MLSFLLLFNWIFTRMQTFLSKWVLFLLIHYVLSNPGSMLKHGYSRIVYGHRLDGKTISSFAPISFLDCVEECLVRNRCRSVSYFKGANYCEIKYEDKLTAESSYQKQAGWVYSEKGHWPPELAGPCSQSNCSLNEKCQFTRYSNKRDPFNCVVSDCGLPVIYGINESYAKEGDAIGINRAMHVKCSKQHVQHGSGRLVCLSNGTWVYNIVCCEEGWKEFRGHCYFRNNTELNQTDAMSTCRLRGAYLVEIDGAEENNWIKETLLKDVSCSSRKYQCTTWTGANDTQRDGVFLWGNSGAKVTYTNWDKYNPDGIDSQFKNYDCVDMFYTGEWNDRPCSHLNGFICEKDHI